MDDNTTSMNNPISFRASIQNRLTSKVSEHSLYLYFRGTLLYLIEPGHATAEATKLLAEFDAKISELEAGISHCQTVLARYQEKHKA